jgi:hypothetical protein
VFKQVTAKSIQYEIIKFAGSEARMESGDFLLALAIVVLFLTLLYGITVPIMTALGT